MHAVRTWVVAGLVASSSAAAQDLVLEPANLRATLIEAARARYAKEISVDESALAASEEGTWRIALDFPLTPTERLALATSALAGDWTWDVTERGAALRRPGVAEARMLKEILARETVELEDRWGESRVETLLRLARRSELPLVLGADVARGLPDGGRRGPPGDVPDPGDTTVAATLDRLLGTGFTRVARDGRVLVVTTARAQLLEGTTAHEIELRGRIAGSLPLELETGSTLGDLIDGLSAALGAPVRLAPGAGLTLDRARPLGVRATGRVPARTGLWLLEHATGLRACVVGDAVWLAIGERARALHHGPWGDVLLEGELTSWPLALPADKRDLLDAPELVTNEGLSLAVEDHFRIALSRFDMQIAQPDVDTTTVAAVLDRLSSACGARGWHVHRGEIRFGSPPLAPGRR